MNRPSLLQVAPKHFTYEVEAMRLQDGEPCRCRPADADFWSVYQRPLKADAGGARLASWVADFGTEQDAICFADLKTTAETMTGDAQPGRPLFSHGSIFATPGALRMLDEAGKHLMEFVLRHTQGDWGELNDFDRAANNFALRDGNRLMSSYVVTHGPAPWTLLVITEAVNDLGVRVFTTCILAEEA